MQEPPKPKPKTPDDLAEVERALSVLQGRHPEHERARREDEAARAKRREALEAEARAEGRKRARRWLTLSAAATVLIGFIGVAALFAKKEQEHLRLVSELTKPHLDRGFTLLDATGRRAPDRLEVQAPAACLLAVSSGRSPIHVERTTGAFDGAGPLLFCTCGSERLVLSTDLGGAPGGLALLSIDANLLGGSRAFAFADVDAASTQTTDQVCREASFDAWIDAKKWRNVPGDEAWFKAQPNRAALHEAGFHAKSVVGKDVPFGVIEMEKESCLLATSADATSRLALRSKGGSTPVSGQGAIAYCAEAPATLVLSREGSAEVSVLEALGARIGGRRGLRDLTHRSGIEPTVAVAPSDTSWDAKATLLASAVPEMLIGTAKTPDIADDPAARIVALSMSTPGALVAETEAESFSYCDPPLGGDVLTSLCAFSGKQKWRVQGAEANGGLARAQLPFWLFALSPVNDPVALRVETQMVTLARQLRHRGFEPTTLEALTELPNGVEILGRSGEDQVVAVAIAPQAPFAFPLTDGEPWSLGNEPRAVPLVGLAKVTLTTKTPLPSKATRRTVVFRRQKH